MEKKLDIMNGELSLEMEKYKKDLVHVQEENKKLMFQNQNQEKELKELKIRLSESAASQRSVASIRDESEGDRKSGIHPST